MLLVVPQVACAKCSLSVLLTGAIGDFQFEHSVPVDSYLPKLISKQLTVVVALREWLILHRSARCRSSRPVSA